MKKTFCSAALFAGALFAGSGHAGAEEAVPAPAPQHTVVSGDTLWRISAARLGAPERWVEIYVVNRDVLGNPDAIEKGQVLKVPSAPVEIPPSVLANLAPAPGRGGGPAPSAPSASTRPRMARQGGGGTGLATIRRCESGGNYHAVSPGGRYRGAYQFDQQTWESVGGSGDPAAASPSEQDSRAQQLRSQRGSSPWANCG